MNLSMGTIGMRCAKDEKSCREERREFPQLLLAEHLINLISDPLLAVIAERHGDKV
jgi:hypothetical protein